MSGWWARVCHPARQALAAPGTPNHGVLDFFSLLHGLAGVAMGAAGLGLLPTLLIAGCWEIAEHLLKDLCPVAFVHPSQDTALNAASDILFAAFGWHLGRTRLWARRQPR